MRNMITECREQLERYHEKNLAKQDYFASKQHDLLDRAIKEVG